MAFRRRQSVNWIKTLRKKEHNLLGSKSVTLPTIQWAHAKWACIARFLYFIKSNQSACECFFIIFVRLHTDEMEAMLPNCCWNLARANQQLREKKKRTGVVWIWLNVVFYASSLYSKWQNENNKHKKRNINQMATHTHTSSKKKTETISMGHRCTHSENSVEWSKKQERKADDDDGE